MKEKILITGGAGFIGSNLSYALLKENYSVTVIDDLSAGTRENLPKEVTFFQKDICDPEIANLFEGAAHVFHLAAKSNIKDCSLNPKNAARVNVLGTVNVLEACLKNNVPHIIYADTSCEYEGIDAFPSKLSPTKPISVYACTKNAGYQMCEAFKNLHGLKISNLRYFNVYGPAQDFKRVVPPVVAAFTAKLLKKERPLLFGNGSKKRDFIHVDDVNRFHLQLLQQPEIRNRTYNIGSGACHSILEIYNAIEETLKTGLQPIFQDDQPTEALVTHADISETLATGWKPQVEMKKGLTDYIFWMKDRLGL